MKEHDHCTGQETGIRSRGGQKKEKTAQLVKQGRTHCSYFRPPNTKWRIGPNNTRNCWQRSGCGCEIVESRGSSIKIQLQKPNQTATPGCKEPDYLPCNYGRGVGGNCRQSNVEYEFECQLCPENSRSVCLGDTSWNLYSRAKEHLRNYKTGGEKTFIQKHQVKKHNGEEG